MFKNSTELLDYAFRKLQVAVENNEYEVEIPLHENFNNNTDLIRKYCDTLEIKTITEILREEFKDYNIKSIVETKVFSLNFSKKPCETYYPLVWSLSLQKK